MKSQLYRYLGFATALYIMTGCTAGVKDVSDKQYFYNQSHSMAWNISNASGMDPFYDARLNSAEEARFNGNDYDLTFPHVDNSKPNENSLSLKPLLQYPDVGFKEEDWQRTGILAWIPTDLASTPSQASKVLLDVLQKAIEDTLKEESRPYEIFGKGKYVINWLGTYVFQETPNNYITIKFEDKKAGCKIPEEEYIPGKGVLPYCGFFFLFNDPVSIVGTPDFINKNNTGKSYLVGLSGTNRSFMGPVYEFISLLPPEYSNRRAYSYYQQISRHLPPWVILHVAQHATGLPAVILKEGKTYFFMRDDKKI